MQKFQRRFFLQWLSSLPLLGLWIHPAAARPVPEKYLMNQFRIAGLAYYDVQQVVRRLQPGTELCLVAEPTNPHDEFAVEVFYGECKLGYIPRSDNRHISRLLQQGVKLSCDVLEARPETTVWDMVRVRVSLVV
ncbi:MAG: HIRAN domain-containing protein [Candidatus Competibacteraceae bacterium]